MHSNMDRVYTRALLILPHSKVPFKMSAIYLQHDGEFLFSVQLCHKNRLRSQLVNSLHQHVALL